MRKIQFTAFFWTFLLAIPFTALALSLLAYTTTHMNQIIESVANLSRSTTVGGRGWILEFAERWPEIAGMIIGQLVIMIILVVARRVNNSQEVE